MSTIDLSIAKARLRTAHDFDDADIQQAVDGAEQELLRFMGRDYLPTLPLDYPEASSSEDVPSEADTIAADVIEAVLLLVKASYEATTPDEINGYRQAAFAKAMPHRLYMGV